MDDCEKFNEILLPEKEDFYSHLNMEDITEADYAHAKRVCKDFKIKNLLEYHDLQHIQSDTLLLAFEKTKVKLDLLTDIDMLLTVEKDIRDGMSHYLSICPS